MGQARRAARRRGHRRHAHREGRAGARRHLILVGRGRDADVFALDGRRVLRRYRSGRSAEGEALVMEHARRHGFPVPAVHEARGPDLVLDRAEGPTLTAALGARPWTAGRSADLLASLHRRLQAVPAPSGLARPLGEGDRLLHLDLHPDNVLLTPAGPVVIDWANAAAGPAGADAALTWVILATGDMSPQGWRAPLVALLRRAFTRRFVARAGRDVALAHLADACAYRLRDANVSAAERERVRALGRMAE